MRTNHMHLVDDDTKKRTPKRLNFTLTALRSIKKPATGRTWVYDERQPGLAFMLMASGTASFYCYKRVGDKPERIRLGGFPEISVEKARELAAKKLGEIADGVNPQERKRSARAALTFGEVFSMFMEQYSKLRKRTWKEDQQKYDAHLVAWANRKAGEIGRDDVEKLHAKIGRTAPGQANRVVALASKVFNWANITPNPCKGIEHFAGNERERFIEKHEMPRFFEALGKEDQLWQDFFLCALLTGARSGNLQTMRWDEIDFDGALWTIPGAKFKNGKKARVVLVPDVMDILRRRQADQQQGDEWVFPGRSEEGHITRPEKSWERIRKNSGLVDVRIHDLRRSCGSWQSAQGSNLTTIGASLGHRSLASTKIYSRASIDAVRDSVSSAADAMIAAAQGKPAEAPKPAPAPEVKPAPADTLQSTLEQLARLYKDGLIDAAAFAAATTKLVTK